MDTIFVVFDYMTTEDVMAFETQAMADSFINHPANYRRPLDVAFVPFRGLPVDLTVPEFVQ